MADNERKQKEDAIVRRLMLYRTYRTMLSLSDVAASGCDRVRIERLARELEQEVRALPVGRERLILELHYFEGNSIEGCAELMGVSRSTAFRIHRRALGMLEFRERVCALHA